MAGVLSSKSRRRRPPRPRARLAVKLYLVGMYFRCRQCHRLAYASQSDDALGRARRRLLKSQRQLGGPVGFRAPTPERPVGMRYRQYFQLVRQIGVAEADLTRDPAISPDSVLGP